jgi:hypothetical protein
MTSDVTTVRPLSPGSGEGPRQAERDVDRGEVRVASHQTNALPDLRFLIVLGAGAHGDARSSANSIPDGST